ncbi:MAG TPA: hypothetical protein VGM25_09180 [Caulobacteraceae bacterium]|jgi:hypothetical protein
MSREGLGWARDPVEAKAIGALALGVAGAAVLALLSEAVARRPHRPAFAREADGEARALHGAAAMLSASVLADSAVEHYRGSYENPGMYTPLVVSALTLATGADGGCTGLLPRRLRTGVYALAAATGAAGVAFHLYNVTRKPGGLNWQNAFYAAPIGAPAALSLAGAIGMAADQPEPRRLGRWLSALTAIGLAGTVGEAGLLHFRGSFQNPFMWAPVSLPPVAAALMAKAAVEPSGPRRRPLTRAWLGLTALLGVAGVGFHAFGISRAMGGWRNWSQNLVDGPPLPAPPSFTALAIAALAALRLRDAEHD